MYAWLALIFASIELASTPLLDENHLEKSYETSLEVLQTTPCDPAALETLSEIGRRWNQIETKGEETIHIYTILNQCHPKNGDTLFYLGRALARNKQWNQAEEILKECLEVAPQYGDARVQLGYLYLWQERYPEAEREFLQGSDNTDARFGLALAMKRQGKTASAKEHLNAVLEANPKHREAHKEKGRLLYSEMDFYGAETEFAWLIDDDPNEGNYWAEMFDIKSHTRYALSVDTFYTEAKENDPSLKAPVVKDYYFMNNVHLIVPLTNRWRLDLKQIYYHQRENDIYPPVGTNYSMFITGGQASTTYFFAPFWRWNISARGFSAWGEQNNVGYPFHKTARFEPGTGLLYNSEKQLFSIDYHIESYVIKNFSNFTSSLLRTDYLTAGYKRKIDTKLKPEVEVWATHIFIHDRLHNWENNELASARCQLPYLKEYVTAIYRFEHGHYNKLNQNYYSFKQQLRNVLGVCLHIPINESVTWDSFYFHRWQTTYNLYQPIGNFIFVSPKQYLVANWVSSTLTARYRDKLRLVLEGKYYHDTLPYRDWTLSGSLVWQF